MKSNRYKAQGFRRRALLFFQKWSRIAVFLAISTVFTSSLVMSGNMPEFSQSPQTAHWKRFMRMKPSDYKVLWESLSLAGKGFSSWSWEWKIGWIRSCKKRTDYCHKVLLLSLEDSAAVVRSAAAEKIANLYYQSGDRDFLQILASEVQKDRNKKLKSAWPVEKQLALTRKCILPARSFRGPKQKEMRNTLAKVCRTR